MASISVEETQRAIFHEVCKSKPCLGTIISAFCESVGGTHYALLDPPETVPRFYVLSSDIIDLEIIETEVLEGSLNKGTNDLVIFNNPREFCSIPNVLSVLVIPVITKLRPLGVMIVSNQVLNNQPPLLDFFVLSVSNAFERMEIDIKYSISRANQFSDEYMAVFAKHTFSVIDYHPSEIFLNTFAMFHRSGISVHAGIDSEELLLFLVELRKHYNDVPYHNWFHALDVTQFVYSVICKASVGDILTETELFGLLLSAICHDTDHNGMNNNFHRNAKTVLAHLAPNLPPLEHHHSCITCDLTKPIFANLQENVRDNIRHFMINCIMATDMEQHKKFLDEFKSDRSRFDKSNPEDRQLLAQIVLKAADLSNTVRDFEEANRMSTRLNNECYRQGDKEIELGLAISPMCDRKNTDPLCVGQVGFYKFVAGPLMKQLHEFFPSLAENEQQFESNLSNWEKQKADFDAKKNSKHNHEP